MAIYTSVKCDPDHKKILDGLAEKANESLVSYLHLAIDYFHKTGVDPKTQFKSFGDELDVLRKDMVKQMKETRDTYISFIREMETKKLVPIANNIQDIGNELLNYLKNEAPTKGDIQKLKDLKPVPPQTVQVTQPSIIEEKKPVISDQDIQITNKRARQLFSEFLNHGKKATFGNHIMFEEKTLEHYKQLFNQL
jgi:hypothetical protein